MATAFKKLTTKIVALSIPFLGIIFFISVNLVDRIENKFVFQAFLIITICYLIEAILSPYERLLEVKRRYINLAIAYLPYVLFLFIIILFNIIPCIGLLRSITAIHGVRLVSLFIIMHFARHYYRIRFPLAFTLRVFSITMIISMVVSYLVRLAIRLYV